MTKLDAFWFSLFVLFTFCVVSLSKILSTSGVAFYGDFSLPLSIERFCSVFQMWNSYASYASGFTNNIALTYMIPFLISANVFNLSVETLSKLMIFTGLFLTGISMFLAVKEILKKQDSTERRRIFLAPLIAAFFYMFNPWSMDRIGHYFLWVSYALAPLVLLLAIKLSQRERISYALVFLTALIWSVSSSWPFGAVLNTFLLISWFLYSILLETLSGQKRQAFKNLKILVSVSTLYLLFNAHWILPYVIASASMPVKPSYMVSFEMVEGLGRKSDYLNVIRLIAYWWPQVRYWPDPPLYIPWLVASVFLPIMALAVLLKKARKHTIYFSLLYILSIPLSIGLSGPFAQVYQWMTFESPFADVLGWVFRDPNKWNSLTALTYALLLGVTVNEILAQSVHHTQLWKKHLANFKNFAKSLASILGIVALIISIAIYASPVAFGYLSEIYTPCNIPQEYYKVNDWLRKQNDNFRVFWVAPLSYGTSVNGTWRYSWAPGKPYTYVLDAWSSGKPSLAPLTNEARRYTDFLYAAIRDGYVDKYLAPLGVKYIVYHNDILGAETQGQLDIESLMAQNELKLVWQEGFINVFEMQSHVSRIFIPSKTRLVVGGLDSLTMLDSIPQPNSNDISILFLQQKFYATSILNITKDAVIINKDVVDFALSFLDKKYVVAPFEYTIHADPLKDWARTNVYEDWWNWPSPKNLTGFWDWDYGMGLVKTTIPNAKLDVSYDVDHAETYGVWVRYLESPLGGNISISVDKNNIRTIDTLGDKGFKWFKAESISLNADKHNLILENVHGFNAINLVALVPLSVENQLLDLVQNLNVTYIVENSPTQSEQLMVTTKEGIVKNGDSKTLYAKTFITSSHSETFAQIVNYTQISPTEWFVHVNTTGPFILEFTETYDPFWMVYSDGLSIQSLPVNSVINGFFINKTGSYTLVIKYKPQTYFYIGLWMSTISFISMFLLLVSPKLRASFSGFRAMKTRAFSKTRNRN